MDPFRSVSSLGTTPLFILCPEANRIVRARPEGLSEMGRRQSIRLAGDEICAITRQTFDTLFKEAQDKKQCFIASVESAGIKKFYDGLAACEWLRTSFIDPLTGKVVENVTVFEYERQRKNIVLLRSIFSSERQVELATIHRKIVEVADIDGQIGFIRKSIRDEDYEAAETMLEIAGNRVQALQSEDIDVVCEKALRSLGELSLHEMMNYEGALLFFEKLHEACPEDVQALIGLAMSHSESDPKKAIFYLEKVLAIEPENPEAVILLVEILEEEQEDGASVPRIRALLERALEKAYDEDVFEKLISVLVKSSNAEDLEKACLLLRERLARKPGDQFALESMIDLYKNRGSDIELPTAQLVGLLERALEHSMNKIYIYEHLIEIYAKGLYGVERDRKRVIEYMEQSFGIYPEERYLKKLFNAYHDGLYGIEKNLLKAVSFLESFLTIAPRNRFALEALSRIYSVGGEGVIQDIQKADEYFKRAALFSPLEE